MITKNNFIVQVENYERHKEVLEEGPYIRQMDLALSCSLLVNLTPREMMTNRVTWNMLKQWDMSPEELFRRAGDDSREQLSPIVEPMSDVIKGFLMEEFLESAKDNMEQALDNAEKNYQKLFGDQADAVPEIYVISRTSNSGSGRYFLYGCSGAFCGGKKFGFNFTSKQHPRMARVDRSFGRRDRELEAMIRDANRQVVLPEEILSDHVYKYILKTREFKIVDSGAV